MTGIFASRLAGCRLTRSSSVMPSLRRVWRRDDTVRSCLLRPPGPLQAWAKCGGYQVQVWIRAGHLVWIVFALIKAL